MSNSNEKLIARLDGRAEYYVRKDGPASEDAAEREELARRLEKRHHNGADLDRAAAIVRLPAAADAREIETK